MTVAMGLGLPGKSQPCSNIPTPGGLSRVRARGFPGPCLQCSVHRIWPRVHIPTPTMQAGSLLPPQP